MRVISGSRKGKRLVGPKVSWVRPTADRTKEFIFDYLGDLVKGAKILDLFAGTGNLGIEALSRGAKEATFVDKAKSSIGAIKKNLELTHFEEKAKVIRSDAFKFLKKASEKGEKFDLIIADPPYQEAIHRNVILKIQHLGLLNPGGYLVLEHNSRTSLEGVIEQGVALKAHRMMGDSAVSFYQSLGGEIEDCHLSGKF